nr:universal stress protein [Spirochaetia bacterium]
VYEESSSAENAFNYYLNELSLINRELTVLIKGNFETISRKIEEKITKLNKDGINVKVEQCHGSLAHRATEIMETGVIDTFVLGSHGKHKLTEYLLGSVTVHIIRKSSLPVFIIH